MAFSMVANAMKRREASMKTKRKVHNEYVLPVTINDSETWTMKEAHMELNVLSDAQRIMRTQT